MIFKHYNYVTPACFSIWLKLEGNPIILHDLTQECRKNL